MKNAFTLPRSGTGSSSNFFAPVGSGRSNVKPLPMPPLPPATLRPLPPPWLRMSTVAGFIYLKITFASSLVRPLDTGTP